jgi:hypothetical protein
MRAKRTMFAVLSLAISGAGACGDGGEEQPGETGDLTERFVVNSIQVTETIPDMKVRLYDLTTGVPFGDEYTADGNGRVLAPRPENSGAYAYGSSDWTATFNQPPARAGEEALIRVSSAASASLVPAVAVYTNDQEASALAGSVLWKNAATGKDELVGCAKIEETPTSKDIRYFGANGLPTSVGMRPLESGTVPANGMGTNDAEAGKFFIANLAAGTQTVRAFVNGAEVGAVTLFVTPRKAGDIVNTTGMPATLHLANIFVNESFATNPTPADCK